MTDSDDGMLSMDEDFVDDSENDDEEIDDADEEDIIVLEHEVVNVQGPKVTDEEYRYDILTGDQVVQFMQDIIKDVNSVVEIPATVTRILLSHYKWDKEKLMECYYDGDQEKLFDEAHVVNPFRRMPESVRQAKACRGAVQATSQVFCEICFDLIPASNLTGLPCGHEFCRNCWRKYITMKIMDEGIGQTISCAAYGCDILVDDETVMNLIVDARVRLKYQQLITNSFVECNRLIRWCPRPDCGHVIKVHYFDCRPVTCKCGHIFCFSCGEMWHDPVQCKWLKEWIRKCDDDSETSNWLAANTKECPKCQSTIEKDGGCNHMVCKRCKFDFCWICLTAWEPHGSSWYNCNRFDEDEAKKARDAQERSRAALQRYLFYCNRYMNHMQSLRFENKLYASVKDRMEAMQQHNITWIEVQFLKKAVDVLCQCRQTLMYTYVFAFYLRKNNQSIIFEVDERRTEVKLAYLLCLHPNVRISGVRLLPMRVVVSLDTISSLFDIRSCHLELSLCKLHDNQKDLENATEQLSEYLERDITSDILIDIKQKVQDKSRYCESRRKVLLDHVHEGYDNDLWEYQDNK